MTTKPDRLISHLWWLLRDSLTHASGVAARAQDATEGRPETILFENARAAIAQFIEKDPAINAIRHASFMRGYEALNEHKKSKGEP